MQVWREENVYSRMIRGKKTVNDSFKKSDYKENMIVEECSFREGFFKT